MKRTIKAMKEGLSVLFLMVIVAVILNFFDFGIGYSKFWNYLGDFAIINVFDEKALNGLIVLGFILGLIVFILGLFFPDKEKRK